MKVRYQADADLNEDIVNGVRRRVPEIDFKTASEAGLSGIDDPSVLAAAAIENRIIVTHDRRTMPRHFADFVSQNICPGVFVVSQHAPVSQVIDDLILIWHVTEAVEYVNSIRSLPL
ncbi:MAG: DUF5615 family PIN-like protein [Acidobacteria bacterium]|nr:DUF5615 family PIN-like protein [Acidobacteriota bacterium]